MQKTNQLAAVLFFVGLVSACGQLYPQESDQADDKGQATSRTLVVRSAGSGGAWSYYGSTYQNLIGLKQIHGELKLADKQIEKLKKVQENFRIFPNWRQQFLKRNILVY